VREIERKKAGTVDLFVSDEGVYQPFFTENVARKEVPRLHAL
jgi:hypothetical protein